jgi:hypothetical protein
VKYFIRLILLFFLFSNCIDNVNLEPIDKLIKEKQYDEAINRIQAINLPPFPDSLLIRRLKQRELLARKGKLFSGLNGDSEKIENQLSLIKSRINKMDSLRARWFFFDYYENLAKYALFNSDRKSWMAYIEKLEHLPTSEPDIKTALFIDAAFYLAENGDFENARNWMDKAMRRIELEEDRILLESVYEKYMNGRFKEADSILSQNKGSLENFHWKRIQSFLNLYTDSLTLKNRFRLW